MSRANSQSNGVLSHRLHLVRRSKPETYAVRSPQSNGIAESFVNAIKRDYAAVNGSPDAITMLRNLLDGFRTITSAALRYLR
jgi:transposase InsO family protein